MSVAAPEADLRIENVRFDSARLIVELSDGRLIGTPVRWYPRLLNANAAQREHWELLGPGIGVHWPEVDEDLSLAGMLAGRAAPA